MKLSREVRQSRVNECAKLLRNANRSMIHCSSVHNPLPSCISINIYPPLPSPLYPLRVEYTALSDLFCMRFQFIFNVTEIYFEKDVNAKVTYQIWLSHFCCMLTALRKVRKKLTRNLNEMKWNDAILRNLPLALAVAVGGVALCRRPVRKLSATFIIFCMWNVPGRKSSMKTENILQIYIVYIKIYVLYRVCCWCWCWA